MLFVTLREDPQMQEFPYKLLVQAKGYIRH
jgi:hypothetical protein